MKILLTRDPMLFPYQTVFSSTTEFMPNLFVGGDTVNDIEPVGAVDCVAVTVDKIKTAETNKPYDHIWLWNQLVQSGKATKYGCSPQDGFAQAVKGQKVTLSGEIDTSIAYFRCDVGDRDAFTNIKSAIQLEYTMGKKRPVGVATYFYPNWLNQTLLSVGQGTPSSHEWEIVGWSESHPDCFQIDAHIGFYQWIPQDVFNTTMKATYGSVALTLADTTQEIIDTLKDINVPLYRTALDFAYNLLIKLGILISTLYGKLITKNN